jgi:hypothetical protein
MTTPTITSRVPQVIDWLYQAAASSPLLGAHPDPDQKVSVFDGPQVPAATQGLERVLWVGADPAALGDPVAEAGQDFAFLDHARTRDEDGAIAMSAQHWSGDTSNKVHRAGAAAIVAGVELLLRGLPQDAGAPGDATMGGLVFWSQVDGPYDWRPRQVTNGALMLVTFHVTYRARLTTAS